MTLGGTYALLLHLDHSKAIQVGALGTYRFTAGWYLYLGSAHGPGGLAARVARHRRRTDKRFHWHIDYVRAGMSLREVWTVSDDMRRECEWARAASELPGASTPVPGLGASDCQCATHLFCFPEAPDADRFGSLVSVPVVRETLNGKPTRETDP
jgi:Uri superfamily endonuclease